MIWNIKCVLFKSLYSGAKNGELLINECRVSVQDDEQVLEVGSSGGYTTM